MSENMIGKSGTLGEERAARVERKNDFSAKANEMSRIGKVIGVMSGKGGVGKSLVTSLLAVSMSRRGYRTAILDADVTGPSIPKAFGIKEKAKGSEKGFIPVKSRTGINVMSINMLIDNETDPVVWRGPLIGKMVRTFWTDVIWGDIDFMFIDMPPGTADVPLTIFQSIAVDGIIVVTSPQELVSMVVVKAVKMAEMMGIPIIGFVENLSYFICPDNGKVYRVFGESHIEDAAMRHGLSVISRIPIEPKMSELCDKGLIETYEGEWIEPVADIIEKMNSHE